MARAAAKRGNKRRGGLGRIIGWGVRAFFLFVVLTILWAALYMVLPPPITFTMIGDTLDGRKISRDWMPLERIDDDMKRAAIAAEDGKFCAHNGFDTDAIAAAMRSNASGKRRIRGGSTISQQTAKNAFLWQGGGYFRKALEAWFTLIIETMWSKERIMEVYLNIAETGIGTYGVNAGAQRYFKKDASNLSRNEAARIAAVLPLPKARQAVTPTGFTRRYGNSIAARIRVVARDGLDACLRSQTGPASGDKAPSAKQPTGKAQTKAAPTPRPERAEDYLRAPDIGAPVAAEAPPPPAAEDPPAAEPEPPAPAAEPAPEDEPQSTTEPSEGDLL
jgi:monofunctional biosynthetic peptidoglycan transglycosylase